MINQHCGQQKNHDYHLNIENNYSIQTFSVLYDQLKQHFNHLDSLNKQYRKKQQNHFLSTFVIIIQKMGHQLAQAKQAVQNMNKDSQIKKDIYCNTITQELQKYKNISLQMQQILKLKSQQLKKINLKNEMLIMQVEQLKIINGNKMQENLYLKQQLRTLKKKAKSILKQKQTLSQLYRNYDNKKSIDQTMMMTKQLKSYKQNKQQKRQELNFTHNYGVLTASQLKNNRKLFSVRSHFKKSSDSGSKSNIIQLQFKQKFQKLFNPNKTISNPFEDNKQSYLIRNNRDNFIKTNAISARNRKNLSVQKALQMNPQTNIKQI